MRSQQRPDPGRVPVATHDEPQPLAAQTPAAAVEEHCLGVAATGPAVRLQRAPARGCQPPLQRGGRAPAQRHYPLLGALAGEADQAVMEVHVWKRQRTGLRDPAARTVEQLQHGPVAAGGRIIADDSIHQRADLDHRQGLRETPGQARDLHIRGGIVDPMALGDEEPVQPPDRHQGPGDGGRGQAAVLEAPNEGDYIVSGDIVEAAPAAGDMTLVANEVPPVGLYRARGPAPLHREPGQELLGPDIQNRLGRRRQRRGRGAHRRNRRSARSTPMMVLASRISPLSIRASASRRLTRSTVIHSSSAPSGRRGTALSPVARNR